MSEYFVYIMASRSKVLYTGVTNNLQRRVREHQRKSIPGFTRKYNVTRLVFVESTADVRAAVQREKQIKGWVRAKKIALVERMNPTWRDLSEDSAEVLRCAQDDNGFQSGHATRR